MTLEQLNQYRAERRELEMLERRIDEVIKSPAKFTFDTVKSSVDFPYNQHVVTVRGVDERAERRHGRLLAMYKRRRVKLKKNIEEIERWIETISDSKVRQIVTRRFLNGDSWRSAASAAYGSPHYEDAARKRVQRYLEENS